jgi:hypothetical protein
MVGAVADQKLVGTNTGTRLNTLLGGMSLENAAVLADTIKGFDGDPSNFSIPGNPSLSNQLREFLIANPRGHASNNHRTYHYVNVPVEGSSTYASGTRGRHDNNVVEMISFCIGVLDGTILETNPRKITKPVAVVLLCHYIGDISQPLHVGAAFFDDSGIPMNPDTQRGDANDTQGGNGLTLRLRRSSGQLRNEGSMHSYWDGDAVDTAFQTYRQEVIAAGGGSGGVTNQEIAARLAASAPPDYAVPTSAPANWSQEWADDIMDEAREAHSRLRFDNVSIDTDEDEATGRANEKPVAPGGEKYAQFAGRIIHDKIPLAGWRLALVFQTLLP